MVKNFFAGIGCLTFLVVLAVAGWLYRDDIREWLAQGEGVVMTDPSPELALAAEEKLEALAEGESEGTVTFTEAELQSYVQYRLAERLPAGVSNPAVDLLDSTVVVSAELDLTALEIDANAAEGLRRMIGDRATIRSELFPSVAGPGQGRLRVISLQAGVIPVPPLMIGRVLDQVGVEHDGSGSAVFLIDEDVRSIQIGDERIVLEHDN